MDLPALLILVESWACLHYPCTQVDTQVYYWPPLEYQTVWQPEKIYNLNTEQVRHSDGYCTFNSEHPLALVFGICLDVWNKSPLSFVKNCSVVFGPTSNLLEQVGQRRLWAAHCLQCGLKYQKCILYNVNLNTKRPNAGFIWIPSKFTIWFDRKMEWHV